MTHEQKINELKGTIKFLYEKEGRSKSYISRLLEVDRKVLTNKIKEWKLEKANIHRLTPSNQKFANKNKQLIKSRLDNDFTIRQIAKELEVESGYLSNIIDKVEILKKAKECNLNRREIKKLQRIEDMTSKSKLKYGFENIEGEIWKDILGHEGYYISNMGRVKRYVKTYDKYILISQQSNYRSGRMYVRIKDKGLSVARLVGFAFVDGYSDECNTIDHIDGDEKNNKAENLQWVSQSNNNSLAYKRGKQKNTAYQKRGKFKKIVLNDKYEFKTIAALAKFLGVSWTQTSRYLDGECEFDGKLEIIY